MLFVEALRSPEQMRAAVARFGGRVPLLANMVEGGKTPFLPARDLEDLGFKLAIYPVASVLAASFQMRKALRTLRETGTTQGVWHEMLPFGEVFNGLLGWDQALSFIDQYQVKTEDKGRKK